MLYYMLCYDNSKLNAKGCIPIYIKQNTNKDFVYQFFNCSILKTKLGVPVLSLAGVISRLALTASPPPPPSYYELNSNPCDQGDSKPRFSLGFKDV